MTLMTRSLKAASLMLVLLSLVAVGGAPSVLAQDCARGQRTEFNGPLFDAMSQIGERSTPDAYIAKARALGVTRMAMFDREQHPPTPPRIVDRLSAENPGFIVIGSPKVFFMRRDLDPPYVNRTLEGIGQGHYRFVGEILYTHGDKAEGEVTATGERYIDPIGPETERLIAGLAGRHIPLLTHWEVYDWDRDWPKFHRLYSAHPEQIFVWPHVGFGTPEQTAMVLGSHPNVWATLSKKENDSENLVDAEKAEDIGQPVIDRCRNLKPEWAAVIERFSSRLVFATDAHNPARWSHYDQAVSRWRVILAQLPPAIATAIAYGNAARLYR
jgi:hypothetical protein